MKRFSTLLIALSMITLSMSSCQREPLEEAIPEKPITTKAAGREVKIYIWNYHDYTNRPLYVSYFTDTALPTVYENGYAGSFIMGDETEFVVGITGGYLTFESWDCTSNNATRVNSSGTLATFKVTDPNDNSPIILNANYRYVSPQQ